MMVRTEFRPTWVAMLVFLVVAATGGIVSWTDAIDEQQEVATDLSHNVLRASDQIDLLIDRLRLATQSLAETVDPTFGTFDISGHPITSIEGFRTALTLTPDGRVLDDSRADKPAVGIDLSDRSYVQAHQVPGSDFYVGGPVYSRVDGIWNLPASLAIRNEDGTLRAIAVFAVGSDYFASAHEIIEGIGATPFIRRQGYDEFFALDGSETPTSLASVFDEAEAMDHQIITDAMCQDTPMGWVFPHRSAIGEFDLAVLLPKAQITTMFRQDVTVSATISLALATLCGVLSGAFAQSIQTHRHQLQQTRRLEERLRLATTAARVGIWDFNLTTGVLAWDRTMQQLYGVREGEFSGAYEEWRSRLHPEDIERAEEEFSRSVQTSDKFTSQFRINADGKIRYLQSEAMVIKNSVGEPVRVIGVNFDVTDRVIREKELEDARHAAEDMHAKMERDALHDSLTGLYNRRGLEKAVEIADQTAREHTLILIDLDRFKLVNDSLGHQAGDTVLRAVSARLDRMKQPGDVVARIGGDEFVILRAGSDPDATEEWAQDTITALAEPVLYNENVCRYGVSMGAAHGSVEALQSGELAQCADHALYQAKGDGRGLFRYFTEQLSQSLADRKMLSNDLERAARNDEFSMLYMPKLDVASGRLIGMEALLRWNHPERGVLAPGAFLELAEALKLTGQIDGHVLDLVLKDRAMWQAEGLTPPNISVNVSTRRLMDPELVDSVISKALPPGAISFELLESVFLDDVPSEISHSIAKLRAHGIGIEIDDFGSGHASILAVPKIEPDFIKIDRALINNIDRDEPARQTVRSIIDMAASHGVKAIAEGVERQEQLTVLLELECSGAQGFLFGKPMTAETVQRRLDQLQPIKAA